MLFNKWNVHRIAFVNISYIVDVYVDEALVTHSRAGVLPKPKVVRVFEYTCGTQSCIRVTKKVVHVLEYTSSTQSHPFEL